MSGWRRGLTRIVLLLALAGLALDRPAVAQTGTTPDEQPAFSLASSEVFTTREAPSVFLTFRRVPSLDVRIYRVRDPLAFLAGLRDPHQLGSGERRPVPQELSAIERLAQWKRRQRGWWRNFLRAQFTHEYRAARTASQDRAAATRRVQLNVSAFAQVPLLNPDQLVTSWREVLPNHRDAEMRRLPLALTGPGLYVVEGVHGLLRAYTVVIVSDVGLVTKTSPGQLLMFAADRFTGEPAAGCDARVLVNQTVVASGQTSADGVYEARLADVAPEVVLGVARCGDAVAVTDPGSYSLHGPARQLVGLIYTDKPIYRPGQQVHVKGVLRWRDRDALAAFDRRTVELVASDPNDKVIFRRPLDVDAFGSLQATIDIPATAALGGYALRVESQDQQAIGAFEVQEYRKPEFEVVVTTPERFVVQGREAVFTVQARYYFGQPVANGHLRWVVNQQPYYSPFRWDDSVDDAEPAFFYGTDQRQQGTLRLDANGRAAVRVRLDEDENERDYTARFEAQVTDSGSREVSGRAIVNATWGAFLLSARTSRYVVSPGSAVEASVSALDYMGAARADVPVTVALERVTYRSYREEPEVIVLETTTATTDAAGRASAALTLPPGQTGSFRISASADAGGRTITDRTYLWVPGRQDVVNDGDQYLELIADKRTYQPGDTARLLVRGETLSGPVFLTKEGQQVSWHRLLRPTPADTLDVPIGPDDTGDVYVNLVYLRDGRLYRAERRLSVPALDRTLQLEVSAEQAVSKPREPGVFSIRVTDRAGAPVRAQVSLAVVDEAVFAVKPDETPDPVRFFYRREYSRVNTTFSREYYFTGYSGSDRLQLAARRRRPFTLADFKSDKLGQPDVRKDFPDAIYWAGDLVTDAQGRARVSIRYPDALTTWRLTARAITAETHAGSTVARTTTTKDLIVRVITPRFLTEGDEVVLPTIVHNYRDAARTATLAVQASGLDPATAGQTAAASGSLTAGGERRDDWRFAARTPGSARVTASARTETDADAVELPIPVVPYGLRREATASGAIAGAGEAHASVTIPASSNPNARTLRVKLAPSLAGSLLGALDFLTGYPYGCTEQTLSSFLPTLLVTRALVEVQIAPTERLSSLDRMVSAGLRRLLDLQHEDGGWGWWKSDANHPFMTAYALWGLSEAARAGIKLDRGRVESGARALARMYREYPRAVPDLKAYMAYALQLAAGDRGEIAWYADGAPQGFSHAAARDELWAARDRMTAYGRALTLLTFDAARDGRGDELARTLEAEAVTIGELSSWASPSDPLLFDSVDTTVEATALAVQALAARAPRSPVLDRAVRFLLLNRTGGDWGTTKQTAMAVYGLLAVMRARGERAEPFNVDVYVNGVMTGTHRFAPAAMTAPDPLVVDAPAQPGANQVRLVKRDAGGTVYWSAIATYFDIAGAAERTGSRMLAVGRRYALLRPVTVRNRIVYRETPFTGSAAPGDVLTVRLTVAGSPDWRYLMLEDPLPAGVEAVQDTTAYPLESPRRDWWWGLRVEYRDQRTVFFQEQFNQGRYEYVYFVKVISAGDFRAAPAQVSPMYVPNVFASSDPLTMTVSAPQAAGR